MSLRALPMLLLAALLALLQAPAAADASRLQCGVCEAIVDEVNAGIAATSLKHSVQTRFRVDEKKRIPYARTEHNLIEIIESKSFVKRFDKYAVVKPNTKSASAMRQAYADAAAGIVPQPEPEEVEPVATEAAAAEPAAVTTEPAAAAATGDAEAATTPAAADAAGDAAATPAAAAAPAKPAKKVAFWPPAGSSVLPLALEHGHAHLVPADSVRSTTILFESGTDVQDEIKDSVNEFVEQHIDEVVLLFHRDTPNIKHKLCTEITESCIPGKKQRADKKKKQQQQQQQQQQAKKKKQPAAAPVTEPTADAATASAQKDEL